MKTWPLFLVLLLLGLSAFIVLRPSVQPQTQRVSLGAGTGIDSAPPVASKSQAKAAEAVGRTTAEIAPVEAALDTTAAKGLLFDRPAATLRLHLVDGDGQGIANAQIEVEIIPSRKKIPGIDRKLWRQQNRLSTNQEGVLEAQVPSGVGLRLNTSSPYWRAAQRHVLALEIEEVVDLGEIVLAPATRLMGKILAPDGQAVAHADVLLEESNASLWGISKERITTSDDDGEYSFEGLGHGHYKVSVTAQGFAKLVVEAQEIDQTHRDSTLDFHLERGESTQGRVLDTDGHPIANAEIYLVTVRETEWFVEDYPPLPNTTPAAITDAEGRFTLRGIDNQASQFLGARAEGFGIGFAEHVKAHVDAIIRLPRYYSLEGKVVDTKGHPIAQARVRLEPVEEQESEEVYRSVTTDATGTFKTKSLRPGSWKVQVQSPFGSIVDQALELGPMTEPLTLVLPVANPLNIHVVDIQGLGMTGVVVKLSPHVEKDSSARRTPSMGNFNVRFFNQRRHNSGSFTTTTDVEGFAHFADLEAQRYDLSAELFSFGSLHQELDVSGTTQEEEITLKEGGRLRVLLVDSAGQIVVQVPVGLRTAESGKDLPQVTTDSAGRAVWDQLEAGNYQVSYRANDADGWWWNDSQEDERAPDHPVVTVEAGKTTDYELMVGDLALLRVVVKRHGVAATDVKVHLQEVAKNQNFFFGGDDENAQDTDGRGRVELPAVKPGLYDIIVKGRASSPATKKRLELYVGPQSAQVDLDGGEIYGSLMGPAGPLTGASVALVPYIPPEEQESGSSSTITSFSTRGGKPHLVFANLEEQDTTTRSNSQGQYSFSDIPEGSWKVVARAEGFATWTSQPAVIRTGQHVDLGEYRFYPGATVSGHDQNWVPPDPKEDNSFFGWGASVRILDAESKTVSIAGLDEDGDFTLEDLPEGRYRLQKGGFRSAFFDLAAGSHLSMDIPLKKAKDESNHDKKK